MSPHNNVLPEDVCCCLLVNPVVYNVYGLQHTHKISILSYGCGMKILHIMIMGPNPILSTTVSSDNTYPQSYFLLVQGHDSDYKIYLRVSQPVVHLQALATKLFHGACFRAASRKDIFSTCLHGARELF